MQSKQIDSYLSLQYLTGDYHHERDTLGWLAHGLDVYWHRSAQAQP
jgi:hypothetical protein